MAGWPRLLRAALREQDSYLLLLTVLLAEYFALMVIPEDRWSRLASGPLVATTMLIYVLLGLVFAFVYLAIGSFKPDAFADQTNLDGVRGSADYLYFSFISLTTVGFGDVVPVGRLARAVVVLEALLGQIFLVTTVARLVALYSAHGPQPPRPHH